MNIALVDDHQLFLAGISLLVKDMSDAFIVMAYDQPSELLNQLSEGKSFGLIICDLIMDDMNGLAFISAIRKSEPNTPILMLSGINVQPPVAEMKTLGANGYIHKSADHDRLRTAIETVLNGSEFFEEPADISSNPTKPSDGIDDDDYAVQKNVPVLSARQVEVLKLIADGASNKDVADSLFISENTVKSHLKQMFIELNVNKRTACVRAAQALGLI